MSKEPYSPYNNTSGRFRKNMLYWSGGFTLLLLVILRLLDQSLTVEGTPDGIVGFELVKNIHDARIMIDMWGEHGRLIAAFSLGIDYVFLISYALFLGLCSYEIGKKLSGRSRLLSRPGFWLSWLMLLAAIYDSIENYSLIKILTGSKSQLWATTSYYFSTIKFAIVFVTLIYIVLGLVMIWITAEPSKKQQV